MPEPRIQAPEEPLRRRADRGDQVGDGRDRSRAGIHREEGLGGAGHVVMGVDEARDHGAAAEVGRGPAQTGPAPPPRRPPDPPIADRHRLRGRLRGVGGQDPAVGVELLRGAYVHGRRWAGDCLVGTTTS